MKKKPKIFFLFFLLSITPFVRGCGEGFGFPFPALIDILEASHVSDTIKNIIESLRSRETLLYLAANFLFACLFALNVIRNERYPRWTDSFMNSLAIHLSAVWVMVALILADIQQPLAKKISEFYGTCFGRYFFDIPVDIANNIDKLLLKPSAMPLVVIKNALNSLNILPVDLMSRAWFILLTASLAAVIYIFKRMKGIIRHKT